MTRISAELTADDAPWAINIMVHRSYARWEEELELVLKHKPPIVITALGSPVAGTRIFPPLGVGQKLFMYGSILVFRFGTRVGVPGGVPGAQVTVLATAVPQGNIPWRMFKSGTSDVALMPSLCVNPS